MPVEVVLILGCSNAGKSTLVRSLTGIGSKPRGIPVSENVALLNWLGMPGWFPRWTLCLASSLNEGHRQNELVRDTIKPRKLLDLRDKFEAAMQKRAHPEFSDGHLMAILCVSTTVQVLDWAAADYLDMIEGGGLKPHCIKAFVEITDKCGTNLTARLKSISPLSQVPTAPRPRNACAERACLGIGLQ